MINENKEYELIKFEDGEFSLDVNVSPNEDTVWMTLDEIGFLFERDRSVIGKHIKKIYFDEELDKKFVEEAKNYNIVSIKGHRAVGGMRASIYNAMPIEGVKALVEFMKKFEVENL